RADSPVHWASYFAHCVLSVAIQTKPRDSFEKSQSIACQKTAQGCFINSRIVHPVLSLEKCGRVKALLIQKRLFAGPWKTWSAFRWSNGQSSIGPAQKLGK